MIQYSHFSYSQLLFLSVVGARALSLGLNTVWSCEIFPIAHRLIRPGECVSCGTVISCIATEDRELVSPARILLRNYVLPDEFAFILKAFYLLAYGNNIPRIGVSLGTHWL